MFNILFILLNILSGFIETGAVIFGIHHYDIAIALIAALFYQVGNLIPIPLQLSKRGNILLAAVSLLLMLVGIRKPFFAIIGVMTTALSLKGISSFYKVPEWKDYKRILRMIGFFLGFGFNAYYGAVSCLIIIMAIYVSKVDTSFRIHVPLINKLNVILILHEMHYFVYSYSVLIIAYNYGGGIFATLLFFLGWIAYVVVRKVVWKRSANYKRLFIIGHAFLTIVLIYAYIVPSWKIRIVLWLLTGFGGTTEFCIGELEKTLDVMDGNHTFAENIGHILGTAVGFLIYRGSFNLLFSVLAAAVFAFSAMLLMTSVNYPEVTK